MPQDETINLTGQVAKLGTGKWLLLYKRINQYVLRKTKRKNNNNKIFSQLWVADLLKTTKKNFKRKKKKIM